jgi:hypothetical protein
MKYTYIILVGILGMLLGCEDQLEIKPTNSIPTEDVFNTERGLRSALMGAYQTLQSASIYQDATLFGDLAADNLIHIGTKKEYRQISDNRIVPQNAYIEGLWNNCYDGINRVNNILASIENVPGISKETIEDISGQCYFLRAFFHFNLTKYFGGVVIKNQPTLAAVSEYLNAPRATEQESYRFVINDLLRAENHFLNAGSKSMNSNLASLGPVQAFLARVYLYNQVYDSAAIRANQVINMNYQLETENYDLIFTDQAGNDEIIFKIQFVADEAINGIPDWTLPNGRFEVAAYENYSRETSVASQFTTADIRKKVTINDSVDVFYCNKYQDLLTDNDHVVIFRLSEMYLIRAEALNEIAYVADDEAFDLLNTIRLRANISPYTSDQIRSQEDFRLAIEQERRLEFAFEGHRYFDLKRTGRINEVLPDIGTLGKAKWLFPIPQSELDTNQDTGMVQNTGY